MANILTYEEFDKVLTGMKTLYDNLEVLSEAVGGSDVLEKFSIDFAIETLETMFEDKKGRIRTWMFEQEFGDNTDWDWEIKDVASLYEILTDREHQCWMATIKIPCNTKHGFGIDFKEGS